MEVEITDNSAYVLEEFANACFRALERCGEKAEDYAIDLCPEDTGALKNSIHHLVDENTSTAIVYTDKEYSVYVEMGTGKYYPGGRDTPWAYQDAKGNWHRTEGQKAQPYIKPAVADHTSTYENIIKSELKGG